MTEENLRQDWGTASVERVRQDLRFAARLMIKAPGFTAIAILTLAVGVGASTAIFSQINAVFWKTLPVDSPRALRSLVWSAKRPPYVGGPNVIAGPRVAGVETFGSFSYPAYKAMRDGSKSFTSLACYTDLGEARPVVMRDVGFGAVHFVSGNYFETLGVRAAIGRTFTAEDDAVGAAAAIVSDSFWRRQFGGSADAVRRTIDLNGKSFAVVGVMPAGFFGLDPSSIPDVMVPVGAIQIAAATVNPLQNRSLWQACRVFGRLRPGVTDEQARLDVEPWLRSAAEEATAAVASITGRPAPAAYELPRLWVMDASRGLGTLRDAMSTPLMVLMGVVVSILLIACANIAGLLVVRGAARQREIGTRLALGASRGRLVRQLLTESLLLSAAGGIVGVGFAFALARISPALMSRFMPTLYGANRQLGVVVTPDAGVLLFSAAITLLTGVVFGCLPALRSTRIAPIAAIKQAASGRARTGFAADKLLVALQAALSVGLVIVAGLFVRTISNLRTAPLGYEPGGLLYARIEPRTGGITQPQRADFFEHARQRLERVPGVIAATATDNPPLGRAATIFLGGGTGLNVCTPGFVPANPQDAQVGLTTIGPRYFETLRMRIVAGRELTWADASGGPDLPPVGIVNEAFARKFFAGKDPLDQRFGFSCPSKPDTFRVIGVVADSRNLPRQQAGPTVYLFMGGTANVVTLIARTAGRPESMIPAVRRAITDLNASVPTFGEITPIELREQQMQQERLLTNLLFAFGAVALLLSSIGIYGMLAYMVSRRTSEIGLRMALGAQRRDVVAMVIRESVVPVAGGLAAGAAAALMTARWIDSLLFEVSAYDPWTLAASAAVFLTIAAAAAIVPARRASLVDPLRALRTE